jgi:acyl carrier protein
MEKMSQDTTEVIYAFLVRDLGWERGRDELFTEHPRPLWELFDSSQLLETVTFCEDEFGVDIPDNEVVQDHFVSLKALADMVDAKRATG